MASNIGALFAAAGAISDVQPTLWKLVMAVAQDLARLEEEKAAAQKAAGLVAAPAPNGITRPSLTALLTHVGALPDTPEKTALFALVSAVATDVWKVLQLNPPEAEVEVVTAASILQVLLVTASKYPDAEVRMQLIRVIREHAEPQKTLRVSTQQWSAARAVSELEALACRLYEQGIPVTSGCSREEIMKQALGLNEDQQVVSAEVSLFRFPVTLDWPACVQTALRVGSMHGSKYLFVSAMDASKTTTYYVTTYTGDKAQRHIITTTDAKAGPA